MRMQVYFVCLCFSFVWTALPTSIQSGFGIEVVISKLDILQNQLNEMQHDLRELKRTGQARDDAIHVKLAELESIAKARDVSFLRKLAEVESNLQAKGDTFQAVLQNINTTEVRSRNKLEELELKLMQKIDNLEQQQNVGLQKVQSDTKKIFNTQVEFIKNQTIQAAIPRSCKSASNKMSGKYVIQLDVMEKISVFCEQAAFGGGWIVVQYRYSGNEDFYRSWADYRNGFGDLDGEFWLGLESLHKLTSARKHELMVEIKDAQGNYGYAHYDEFEIIGENEMYRMKFSNYSGTAGNSLQSDQGQKFTTKDRDNDIHEDINCAEHRRGAWWFSSCSASNLNGPYKNTPHSHATLNWYYFKNDYRSLSYTRMMIRELDDTIKPGGAR